jgi:hypothetical protein
MSGKSRSTFGGLFPHIVFGLLGLAFASALLVFRQLPQEAPIPSLDFTLYGKLHLVLGYDSPEFMQDAHDPARLLEPRNIRQSRPGLILLAAGVERLLGQVDGQLMDPYHASGGTEPAERYLPYVAYIMLNFLLLGLSFFVFWHTLERSGSNDTLAAAFLGGLLIFNGVIKSFLWTPHTQLFNILAPLVCLYAFQGITRQALFGRGRMLVLAFLAGLGVTAYGTFLLFFPSVLIAQAWVVVRDRLKVDWRMLARLALVILLAVVPFLAWVFYVRTTTGSFYQYEYSQGQFSWILPLLRSAPLRAVRLAAGNFGKIVLEAGAQAAVLPAALAAVILVTADREHPLADRLKRMR